MPSFFDDFERANGSLGANWVSKISSSSISAGLAVGSNYWMAVCNQVSDNHRSEATTRVLRPASGFASGGPVVRTDPTAGVGYCLVVGLSAGVYTLFIKGSGNYAGATIASIVLTGNIPAYFTLRLIWEDGALSGYYEGTRLLQATDITYQTNTYCGITGYGSTGAVMDFQAIGGLTPAFTVTPNPCGNYGQPVSMTATGGNTSWTSGTPGSPAFTVDHGSISGQVVASATSATFTYDPGTFLGTATFTDPSSGATCAVLVTSNPTVVPVGGVALSPTALAYIERSAIAEAGGTIVNREQQINAFAGLQTLTETITTINAQVTTPTQPVAGVGSLLAFVIEIFDLINGGNNWGGAATVFGNTSLIKSGVDDANTAISDMRGAGGVTLATLAAALSNLRGVGQPSLADVLSAISTPDLGPISDKLDAMRGDTTTSLYTLLSSLAGIRTLGAYSLGDVREWIGTPAQAKPDATAVAVGLLLLALLAAPETGGASVAVLAAAEGAGPVLDVATLVELVSVAGELAGVVADLAELKAKPVSGYAGAPVWPGAANVDLGTSVSLGSRGTITEAMDGVVVDIDHTDPDHKIAYSYDGALAWRNIGCLAFADDAGRLEGYQPFCFASQIFTPKSLRRAASVRWFTGHGPIGTIRAWTVKP